MQFHDEIIRLIKDLARKFRLEFIMASLFLFILSYDIFKISRFGYALALFSLGLWPLGFALSLIKDSDIRWLKIGLISYWVVLFDLSIDLLFFLHHPKYGIFLLILAIVLLRHFLFGIKKAKKEYQ